MTTETVREVAERDIGNADTPALPAGTIGLEGDRAWSACFDAFMRQFGDYRIIRGTCPTCGGSRGVERAIVVDGEVQTFSKESCPDCADTPVFVIEPAPWRDCKTVLKGMVPRGSRTVAAREEQIEKHATAVLQALLPGARVAESVGYIHDNSPGDPTFYLWAGVDTTDVDGYEVMKHQVAILATQAREEVEHAEDTENATR